MSLNLFILPLNRVKLKTVKKNEFSFLSEKTKEFLYSSKFSVFYRNECNESGELCIRINTNF